MQDLQPRKSLTGVSSLNPRALSDKEFMQYYSMLLDFGDNVPVNWQAELLRRFNKRLDTSPY